MGSLSPLKIFTLKMGTPCIARLGAPCIFNRIWSLGSSYIIFEEECRLDTPVFTEFEKIPQCVIKTSSSAILNSQTSISFLMC